MDTCFPLLKLKHHCVSNRRGRGAAEGEEPSSERPCGHAAVAAAREGEGRAGGGGRRSPARPCPARRQEAQPAVHTWAHDQAEGEDPHLRVALSSVFFFFFSLLLKGDYILAGKTSHFCALAGSWRQRASQAEERGSRTAQVPWPVF